EKGLRELWAGRTILPDRREHPRLQASRKGGLVARLDQALCEQCLDDGGLGTLRESGTMVDTGGRIGDGIERFMTQLRVTEGLRLLHEESGGRLHEGRPAGDGHRGVIPCAWHGLGLGCHLGSKQEHQPGGTETQHTYHWHSPSVYGCSAGWWSRCVACCPSPRPMATHRRDACTNVIHHRGSPGLHHLRRSKTAHHWTAWALAPRHL